MAATSAKEEMTYLIFKGFFSIYSGCCPGCIVAVVVERLLPHAFLVANDPDSVNHFHHSISRRIGNDHLESSLTNQAGLLAYKFNFSLNSAKICH